MAFAGLFAILWPVVFGVRPRRGIASGLIFVASITHFRVEGYRWQMIPLYLVSFGLIVGDIVFLDRNLAWSNRISRGVFGTAGLALAATLPLVLPILDLPMPSGQETIGTIQVELTDFERDEIFGENPGLPRHIVTQVWYPAVLDSTIEPQPIYPDWDLMGPALSKNLGLPGWFLSHVRYVNSHSYESLPISPGKFPVVLYSHGWTGYRSVALNQIETLVSNGYIVIAADHTYGAIVTEFEDGEVVRFDPAALPDEETVTPEVYDEAATQLVEIFSEDLVTILDNLDLGSGGPFGAIADSTDLERIGVFGHSTGGGAAVRLCLIDERCDAVLGMDPWVEPLVNRVLAQSAAKPALFMRSVEWQEKTNDAVLRGIAERSVDVTYWIGIDDTAHNDFVLTPLLSPLAADLGLKGPIPAGRIIPIINQYLLGFFDVFLLGTGPASIDTVTFDEVNLEVIDNR